MKRAAILSLVLVLGSGVRLKGEDLWNTSFKLSLGTMQGANTAGLGQNRIYGAGIGGVYPFTRNHAVVFEGGYRLIPTVSEFTPDDSKLTNGTSTDQKTSGYFGGVAYRYRFTKGFLDGLYVQGGVRNYSLRTQQVDTELGAAAGGGDLQTTTKGVRTVSTKPVLGAGFCFTDNLSLELTMGGIKAQNVNGVSKSMNVLELVLDIHF